MEIKLAMLIVINVKDAWEDHLICQQKVGRYKSCFNVILHAV